MLAGGAALPHIISEAVNILLAQSGADRAAVWMDSNESLNGEEASLTTFRGLVAERNGDTTPAEWKRLSPEAPLVRELLARGETAELQLDGTLGGLSMGALLEMRRAICAPIQMEGSLRGIVIAAARSKQAKLDKSVVERLATELALVAQVEHARRRARERQEDVVTATRLLAMLGSGKSVEKLLANVAENCTRDSNAQFGPAAIFAVIGETSGTPRQRSSGDTIDRVPLSSGITENSDGVVAATIADEVLKVSWRSGDATWTSAVDREPISSVWRQALKSRQVVGADAGDSSREVGRIVAFPLEAGREVLGVLIAGLRHRDASLATLERLQLRAAIATHALLARKRNRQVEQQKSLQRARLEVTDDAVILLDPDGRIRKLSHKAEWLSDDKNAFGRGGARKQRHFTEIFHARDRSQIEAWLRGNPNGHRRGAEEPQGLEGELANGRKVRLEAIDAAGDNISAVLLKSLRGKPAEPEVTRAEAELRNVIEWLDEGVVLFDERQAIRAMNTRFAQMAGLTPEESAGTQTFNGLVARLANQTAEPEKFASRWLAAAYGRESGVREEIQLLRPIPRVLERAARPVLDAQGGRLGRVEIYRDLTAQRVFQTKLIRTEKLAALGQMVTTIAHELSNPLTSILGYAQRLAARIGSRGPANEARQILQESERASTILKQLLVTARNSRPDRRKVQLNQIVTRTIELQDVNLRAEAVQIELDLEPGLPMVLADAGQLQQVLMNLIGNARQAIEQQAKSGTIRIRTKRAGGTHVLLEVSDDGPGIPEAIVARIFDPFFTTKPTGIGTGLGLSIVLGIVRDHGGQVRVTSPPGGGATFSIELAALPGEEIRLVPQNFEGRREDEDEGVAPKGERERVLEPWAGTQVLVVEDEATVAQLIADVLKDEGLEVEVLLDGREALRRAATENYELVICDMKMPDLDGEQFYRLLARTQNPLSRRTLFVTGDVLAAHTRQFLERNALAHLAKPFRVEELAEKVRQVLAETSPRRVRSTRTKVARH